MAENRTEQRPWQAAVITLSSGNVQKICFVEVQGEDEIKGTVLMTE